MFLIKYIKKILSKAWQEYHKNKLLDVSPILQKAIQFHETGSFIEAENLYKSILESNPRNHETLHLYGILHSQKGDFVSAIKFIRDAIEINTQEPAYFNNLGTVYCNKGDFNNAIFFHDEAVKINPNFTEAYYNKGIAQYHLGQFKLAIESFKTALKLKPNHIDALFNLSSTYRDIGNFELAIDGFTKTLKLAPDYAKAANGLARTYEIIGELDKSLEIYHNLISINPDYIEANSNLLFSLNYHTKLSSADIFKEHQLWAQRHAITPAAYTPPYSQTKDTNQRLRIGYVSPDFRTHSVAFFIEPILKHHNSHDYEIFAYYNNNQKDIITQQLQNCIEHWRDVIKLNDEELVQQILDDKIDILVDLAGHTANNRMHVFARKPAPIQITYLGYPNTSGIKAIDYRLTDELSDPQGQTEQYYTEKLLRLPHSFLCYQPPTDLPEVNALPALENNFLTFGCFNNSSKINDDVIVVWAKLLNSLPDARMILKSSQFLSELVRKNISDKFIELEVDINRVDYINHISSYSEHLKLYNQIDIALDTFPYNGTTTTCEALCMGVPVITLAGGDHRSRVGFSILSNVNLNDFITDTPSRYVEIAVQYAEDYDALNKLRSNLRNNLYNSSILNHKETTAHIESFYKKIWEEYNSNKIKIIESLNTKPNNIDETKKPGIRILHNMARSGGTLISKCLGSMRDIVLFSEIHPYGTFLNNPINQAYFWHELLSSSEYYSFMELEHIDFDIQILKFYERCIESKKTMIIRDWSHLDFNGAPFLDVPTYKLSILEHLNNKFEIIHTTNVRHPIDQWLSMERLTILQGKTDIDTFLEGFLHFAKLATKIGFVKYEDFTKYPDKTMQKICDRLEIKFDSSYTNKWADYKYITGDTSGDSRGKKEIVALPRYTVEKNILKKFENNENYWKSLQILGYEHEY